MYKWISRMRVLVIIENVLYLARSLHNSLCMVACTRAESLNGSKSTTEGLIGGRTFISISTGALFLKIQPDFGSASNVPFKTIQGNRI